MSKAFHLGLFGLQVYPAQHVGGWTLVARREFCPWRASARLLSQENMRSAHCHSGRVLVDLTVIEERQGGSRM